MKLSKYIDKELIKFFIDLNVRWYKPKKIHINKEEGDLLSNCCASDFDPMGFEKEEGIWQERCLSCGELCEPLWISNREKYLKKKYLKIKK